MTEAGEGGVSQPEWMKDAPAWVRERRAMNEAEWLAGPGFVWMLHYLEQTDRQIKDKHSRRLRLFACACCRRVWELLRWDVAKRCVELAESYADGEVTRGELLAAHASAAFDSFEVQEQGLAESEVQLTRRTLDAIGAARFLTGEDYFRSSGAMIVAQETAGDSSTDFVPTPRDYPTRSVDPDEVQQAEQQELLKEIVGNPFRTILLTEQWLSRTVLALSRAAYLERALPSGHLDPVRLSILADALEDAGCTDTDILSHLRSPGPHVRGCWALDLILGKE
jgi:hypothetical protein